MRLYRVNKDLVQMDKQILSKLKPWVGNNRQWLAFNDYIDALIEQQHKALEQSDSNIMMYRSQGAVATLRKLKMLQDEVNGSQYK
jgi:hypothetical protein